ncbi:MAG: glutathione peroxidase [Saprospiraceae bacterium]
MNYFFNFITYTTLIGILNIPFTRNANEKRPDHVSIGTQSLYDFKMKVLDADLEIELSKYKGKKVVILNVASACGYTPQYANWQKFQEIQGRDGLSPVVVLGFPSNDFGQQEPGTDHDIATFCEKNYGVTFQMFEKITVKGENKHPLYKWLSTKELNGWNDKEPTWNFCKYVINEKGELTNYFGSKVLPTDEVFLKAIGWQ